MKVIIQMILSNEENILLLIGPRLNGPSSQNNQVAIPSIGYDPGNDHGMVLQAEITGYDDPVACNDPLPHLYEVFVDRTRRDLRQDRSVVSDHKNGTSTAIIGRQCLGRDHKHIPDHIRFDGPDSAEQPR